MTDAIETLEHDANACELECPHGIDSRERAAEQKFVDMLNDTKFDALNLQFKVADPRIAARKNAAKADLTFTGNQ